MKLIDFLAGATVGTVQTLFGQPFDYLKVKYQTTQINQNKKFTDFNRQILSKNKLFGYYRGSSSLLFALPIATGFYFSLNQALKRRIVKLQKIQSTKPPEQVLKLRLIGVAGVATGLISSFLICPIQFAKVKRQVNSNPNVKGSLSIILNSISKGEIKQLFSGLTSTFKRQAVGGFIYFTVFEQAVRTICRFNQIRRQNASFTEYFYAGGLAGFAYWAVTYPWDHLKTRVQSNMAGQLQKVSSLKSAFRGYPLALIRGTFTNALGLAIYQQIKTYLQITHLLMKA